MDTPAFITIEQVVSSFLNRRGIYSLENFERYKQIVIEGFTDLNLHTTNYLQYFHGTPSDAGILSLPADFVDYYDVSILIDNVLWPLKRNDRIPDPTSGSCMELEINEAQQVDLDLPAYVQYGSPGGMNVGEFKVQAHKRRIVFKGADVLQKVIYVIYISSGVSLDGTTLIPIELRPVLNAYLLVTIRQMDDSTAYIKVKEAEQSLATELRRYVSMKNSFTYFEIYDALASGWKQTPKR